MNIYSNQMQKKRFFNKKYLIILSAFIVWFSISLYAHRSGMTGKTSTTSGGCSCHSSGSNASVTLSNTSGSGSYVFDPSSTNSFSITVSHPTQPDCGVNIAVKTDQTGESNAGSLTPGSGLQNLGGELTHTTAIPFSGGQATVNFTWTAPATPGVYYLRAISNAVNNNFSNDPGDIWNWMALQQVTVAGVTLSSPNGSESWCAGTTHNITWTSLGITTVKIEISNNGGSSYSLLTSGIPASSGSWTWNIPSDQQGGSQYKIRVTDESNANRKDESNSNFTVASGLSITAHPESQTTCTERNIQFSVTATGGGLTYQWRKNSSNISGATGSTYSIASVKSSDAGVYDCVVSSACGNPVTSNPATLSVDITPSITTQPQSQTICRGENLSFSVDAIGTDITYQWKKNGVNINGATGTTFALTNVQATDAGQYTVEVTGKCTPSKSSTPAVLTINTAPVISSEPDSLDVCLGNAAVFTVISSGVNNTYKWFKNDVEIPNSNTPSFSISAVTKNDEGDYHVVISNNCTPQTMSNKALLTVNEAPFILNQPEAQKVDVGANASFSITADNATSYQWRRNNNNLSGKTASSLSMSNVQLADSGNYNCVVSNDCGKDTSITVKLTVEPIGAGPLLTVNTSNVDFGVVIIDNDKDTTLATLIKNSGTAKLDVTSMRISGNDSSEFSIVGNTVPFSLQPNETRSVSLRFSPVSGGNQTASLMFTSNSNRDTSVTLTGFGGVITASVSKSVLNFDTTITNIPIQNTFALNNIGNVDIEILQMKLTGLGASYFNVVSPAAPFTIESGGSQDVVVDFNPLSEGLAKAQINIYIQNMADSIPVMLNGIAVISSVEDSQLLTSSLSGYPNPTANTVYITFETAEQVPYQVAIYDILGNLVKTYYGMSVSNGINSLRWDGTNINGSSCGTGSYICVLNTENMMKSMRLNIIR